MFYEPSLSLNSIAARGQLLSTTTTTNHAHSHCITQFDFHIITANVIHHHCRRQFAYMKTIIINVIVLLMTTTTRMIWLWALHEAKRPSTIFAKQTFATTARFFPAFALHPHLKKIYIRKLQCVSFSDAMVLMYSNSAILVFFVMSCAALIWWTVIA